jgi:hypothetical protein
MMHTQHLPSDVAGKLLDGYHRLGPLDFDKESVRWAAILFVNTAIDYIQPFTREDLERFEQLDALNTAIADILVRLNEYSPPKLPPSP